MIVACWHKKSSCSFETKSERTDTPKDAVAADSLANALDREAEPYSVEAWCLEMPDESVLHCHWLRLTLRGLDNDLSILPSLLQAFQETAPGEQFSGE